MLRPDIDVVLRPPSPAPARVARRALALCALACRSQLEPHAADPEARAIHAALAPWLDAAGVDAEFEPDEARVVRTPLGALDAVDAAAAGWRGEGAATLAWSLGRWTLPDVATAVDAADVAQRLDWLADDPRAFVDGARLRPRTDLVQLAEMLEVAHWRLNRDDGRDEGRDEGRADGGGSRVSLRAFDAGAFRWPNDAAPLAFAADGDLALDGRPLAAATGDERRRARRIVDERRRAVNWLVGAHATYSAVPT
jgi:hypothetical protein